jgi:D-glycero-alpha-D-manno-heptose-7-phosphate kinase
MIITRSPLRITLGGGGTDIPSYYREYGGFLISAGIDKYVYVTVTHPFIPGIYLKYTKLEHVATVPEVQHPIIREALRLLEFKTPQVEITTLADIPAGTGLGSSGSFTTALLRALYAHRRRLLHPSELAQMACEIEINRLGEPIGKQDQYAAAFGGLNIIHFHPNGDVRVEPLYVKNDIYSELQDKLLMFYVGNQRKASDILAEQKKNASHEEKFNILRSMVMLVSDLRNCLYKGQLCDFGKILHENWILKQKLASQITNSEIDDIYKTGISAGASGGKLLGAGGGGFMLFYCEKPNQKKLMDALRPLEKFDFAFEREGSKLIYFADEEQ